MGRKTHPLSLVAIASKAKQPGHHAVGGVPGLFLAVAPSGARSWVLRYSVNGRRREMGLGAYDVVKVETARDLARAARARISAGADPIAERIQTRQEARVARARSLTFDECADAFLEAHGDAWKNAKHRQQWANTLTTYCGPVFGLLPVDRVDTALVLKALEPIWKTKAETASRLRGRIEQVLSWATVRGYRQGENPARWRGHLDQLLPATGKIAKVEHHAALPFKEIGAFMVELRQREAVAARALEFLILTAARSGEVRGMTWGEVDFDAAVWTVPPERMKAKREHRVPLTARAVEILKAQPHFAETPLVFPGLGGRQMSDMTLGALLKRMGHNGITTHGFRSTFRDWASETTTYDGDTVEAALAHAVKSKTEAAYRRGDMLEKRKWLMESWAMYCEIPQATTATVVPIRSKAA